MIIFGLDCKTGLRKDIVEQVYRQKWTTNVEETETERETELFHFNNR